MPKVKINNLDSMKTILQRQTDGRVEESALPYSKIPIN